MKQKCNTINLWSFSENKNANKENHILYFYNRKYKSISCALCPILSVIF